MRLSRRRVRLTRQQSLASVPVPNTACTVTRDDSGLATITIPLRRTRAMSVIALLLWLPKGKRERVVELDTVGSYVHGLCDGRRTIQQIVDIFAGRYKLTHKEATLSITAYVEQLARRGIVALMVPKTVQSALDARPASRKVRQDAPAGPTARRATPRGRR